MKASYSDKIPIRLIHSCSPLLATPLAVLYSQCLLENIFSYKFKKTFITPIPKKVTNLTIRSQANFKDAHHFESLRKFYFTVANSRRRANNRPYAVRFSLRTQHNTLSVQITSLSTKSPRKSQGPY